MNDNSPKPTKEWTMPTPEALEAYMERIKTTKVGIKVFLPPAAPNNYLLSIII
jgi:hypothetical protein